MVSNGHYKKYTGKTWTYKNLRIKSNNRSESFIEISLERKMGVPFKKHDPATYHVAIAYKKNASYYIKKLLTILLTKNYLPAN